MSKLKCSAQTGIIRIADLKCFIASSWSGVSVEYQASCETGKMNREHSDEFFKDRDMNNITYVVYSYSTPIAWRTKGLVWRIPDAGYSTTTKKHIAYTKRGITERGEEIEVIPN